MNSRAVILFLATMLAGATVAEARQASGRGDGK